MSQMVTTPRLKVDERKQQKKCPANSMATMQSAVFATLDLQHLLALILNAF